MKFELNKTNILQASKIFANNQQFEYTVLPRLKVLYAIKKDFKDYSNLEWSFEFNHTNINNNKLTISFIQNKSEDFSFFYEIPLTLNFEFRVFLAKSSVHFLDIYNFLLAKELIFEEQFRLQAEYHTIPHFIINKRTKRYDLGVINKYQKSEDFDGSFIDDNIKNEIVCGIRFFNPIFNQILDQFKI